MVDPQDIVQTVENKVIQLRVEIINQLLDQKQLEENWKDIYRDIQVI